MYDIAVGNIKKQGALESITKREHQVVGMLAQGMTSKEISSKLYISTHTVESHKRNLIVKMKAKNTVEMVVKALYTLEMLYIH